jgi:hypothetical protein
MRAMRETRRHRSAFAARAGAPARGGAMTSKSTTGRIATTALLLVVAACTPQPWTLSESPETIVIRWYPDESNIAAATDLAEAHCRSWGKSAQLATDLRDGSAEVANYRCR